MPLEAAVRRALSDLRPLTETEALPLAACLGRVAAATMCTPHAMPRFDNSAMDGFALRCADLDGRCWLPVAGEVVADDARRALPEGTALRISSCAS